MTPSRQWCCLVEFLSGIYTGKVFWHNQSKKWQSFCHLYLPSPSWKMKHIYDYFYLCPATQGGRGKLQPCRVAKPSEILWCDYAKNIHKCKYRLNGASGKVTDKMAPPVPSWGWIMSFLWTTNEWARQELLMR